MIYAKQEYPLDRLVLGCIFSVVGLLLIVCHRSIKEWNDYWNSKDFPIGWGEMDWKVHQRRVDFYLCSDNRGWCDFLHTRSWFHHQCISSLIRNHLPCAS